MQIKTASWFSKLPLDHMIIGTSRGTPRGFPAGYRVYNALKPGPWFNSSTIPEYLERYAAILAALDTAKVIDDLARMSGDKVPTLVCFESAASIQAGERWCHRHLIAKWLEERAGIVVEEFGHPDLDRFRKLRNEGLAP
jgi:hypothetical protein